MSAADQRKICFVVSQIGEDGSEARTRANQVLKHVIKPVAKKCGYEEILRADDIAKPGMITPDIIGHLYDDALVIGDLSGRNPNVYYEVAVRQAARKPLVLLIEADERLPFDVADSRTIRFDHRDLDSVGDCVDRLEQQIKAVEENPELVDSPISIGLDLLQLKKATDPASQVGEALMSMMVGLNEGLAEVSRQVQNLARECSRILNDPYLVPSAEPGAIPPAPSLMTRALLQNVLESLQRLTQAERAEKEKKKKKS